MGSNDIRTRLKNNKNIEKSIEPNIPKSMLIELSNLCNHECYFCANSKMTRKRGEIDENFLNRILSEAFDLGVSEVGFYATGEPFVSKNIIKYIKKAKEIGFKYIYITTNGALLNNEKIIEAINAGLDSIKFSINAGTEKTYKIIHGKDDFEKVIRNIKFISEYRALIDYNFKIYASYVVTSQNESEKGMIEKLIGNIVDDIVFMDARNQGGLMYEINENVVLAEKKYSINKVPCPLPFNSMHITYEGYLTACCIDFQNYLVVADLNKQELIEAWLNDEFISIRKKHLDNQLDGTLCYNCIYNAKEEIKPLIAEFATSFDYKEYTKENDILKKISILNDSRNSKGRYKF